jgi:hypothetical protein
VIADAASLIVFACGAFVLLGENRFCYRFLCANRLLAGVLRVVIVADVVAGSVSTFALPAERDTTIRLIFGLMILVPLCYGAVAPFTRDRFAPISIVEVRR